MALPPAPGDAGGGKGEGEQGGGSSTTTITPRLQGLREKVWAARRKHFPDAALSVIVADDEDRERLAALNARMQALQLGGEGAPNKAGTGRGTRAAAVLKAAAATADGGVGGSAAGSSSSSSSSSTGGSSSGSSATGGGGGGGGGSGKKKPAAAPAPLAVAALEGKYLLRFDGGSRGNPGPSGAGVVLYRHGDGRTEARLKEVQTDAVWLGASGTNNEAEYKGLIAGLRMAREMGVRVRIHLQCWVMVGGWGPSVHHCDVG